MPIASRLTNTGTLLVNGNFDEVNSIAPAKFRTTSTTVYAGLLDEFTGAPVVDTSLKLWLDAGQPASYPGTGTTWTDLSGSGFNGTLIDGPTFSSVDGGSIVFDGTDDYVDTGVINLISGTTVTVEVWVNCGSSQNIYANILDYNHSNLGFVIQQDYATLNTFYFAYWNGSGYEVTPTITLPTNTWCQLVFVKSGTSTIGYLNSVNTVSYTGSANLTGTGLSLALGRWLGGAGRVFNGKIASVNIYNRALTAAEIVQNYNALQSRYGLTSVTATQMPVVQRQQSSGTLLVNGIFDEFTGAPIVDSSLTLWLDAGQPASYPGTGTTWTDLSGSVNNATLTNSPTFSSATNGGIFTFNGTTNYISLANPQASAQTPLTGYGFTGASNSTFTLEIWIKTSQVAGSVSYNAPGLISRDSGDIYSNLTLYDGYVYFTHYDGAWQSNLKSTTMVSNNVWHQVVYVNNSNDTGSIYIDGNVEVTGSSSVVPGNYFAPNNIGWGYSGQYFSGSVGSVKFYSRVLSSDEITTNFNALRNRYGI